MNANYNQYGQSNEKEVSGCKLWLHNYIYMATISHLYIANSSSGRAQCCIFNLMPVIYHHCAEHQAQIEENGLSWTCALFSFRLDLH